MQVVVLERLRDAEGGESGARVGVLGKECLQPLVLLGREPVLPAGHAGLAIVEQGGQLRRQGRRGARRARRRAGPRRGAQARAELCVLGQELPPVEEIAAGGDELAQPFTAVPHQQPTAVGVEGDELGT